MRNVEQSAITSLRERGISFHPSELHCFEHAAKPCFVLRVEPRAFYQYFQLADDRFRLGSETAIVKKLHDDSDYSLLVYTASRYDTRAGIAVGIPKRRILEIVG